MRPALSSKKRKVKRKLPRELTRSEKRNRANAEAAVKAAIHRAAVPTQNIRIQQKLIAHATADPGFINKINDMRGRPELFRRITPQLGPRRQKITSRVRSRCLAFFASHDLKSFADLIRLAALFDNKPFFNYLAQFLKKRPKSLPITETDSKLLFLLRDHREMKPEEVMKVLEAVEGRPFNRKDPKKHLRKMKERAIAKANRATQIWREGWTPR